MNACIPLIVALEIEKSNKNAQLIFDLNKFCNLKKGIDFEIHSPHITLWMGFVDNDDLEILKKSFYKVFYNITIQTKIENAILFNGIEGNVLSLNVKKNMLLETLQNRIHHFFEPYRKQVKAYNAFSYATINYINHFNEKSLDHYNPHITVGFAEKNVDFKPMKIQLSNPKIFLMGNNCTCLEVISS